MQGSRNLFTAFVHKKYILIWLEQVLKNLKCQLVNLSKLKPHHFVFYEMINLEHLWFKSYFANNLIIGYEVLIPFGQPQILKKYLSWSVIYFVFKAQPLWNDAYDAYMSKPEEDYPLWATKAKPEC